MDEKGQTVEYLLLIGGAVFVAIIVIIGLNFINGNVEATMFCQEKGFETGKKINRNTSFIFECINTIKEEQCINSYCKTIEKEETKFFKSTIKEVNIKETECEQE